MTIYYLFNWKTKKIILYFLIILKSIRIKMMENNL